MACLEFKLLFLSVLSTFISHVSVLRCLNHFCVSYESRYSFFLRFKMFQMEYLRWPPHLWHSSQIPYQCNLLLLIPSIHRRSSHRDVVEVFLPKGIHFLSSLFLSHHSGVSRSPFSSLFLTFLNFSSLFPKLLNCVVCNTLAYRFCKFFFSHFCYNFVSNNY